MLIHGPGDGLFLCGASASAGPMMTNCFQSLKKGALPVLHYVTWLVVHFMDVVH